MKLYDHVTSGLSKLDMDMIRHVPPGGNWTNIPAEIPSRRLEGIRKMARDRGGVVRTTYYGRLRPDAPSYTISTYFNRPGNGCNIHYSQDRTLSIREAARLQSFPDSVRFSGSQAARRRQVGNAVPVLLAAAVGRQIPPGSVVDLFAGAGGLSMGMELAGHEVMLLADNDKHALEVAAEQHRQAHVIHDDLSKKEVSKHIATFKASIDTVVGGPPCQGWSLAGWHKEGDHRNDLIWCYLDYLERLKPRQFIMENVEGLKSMAGGAALERFISASRKLGFLVNFFVLNASHYGVPQRRKRLFIVGVKSETAIMPPEPIFSEKDLFLPNPITVADAIEDLPHLEPGGGADEMDYKVPATTTSAFCSWAKGSCSADAMLKMYRRSPAPHEVTG